MAAGVSLPGRLKDGATFCYCAYVLRNLGIFGFLKELPTNTTISLCSS